MGNERALAVVTSSDFKDHPFRDEILRELYDASLDYAIKKGFNLRDKDQLEICTLIITRTYQLGAVGQTLPTDERGVAFVRKALSTGFRIREGMVTKGEELLQELGSTSQNRQPVYADLGIIADDLTSAVNEIRLADRVINFSALEKLSDLTAKRKEALAVAAQSVIDNFFEESGVDDEALRVGIKEKISGNVNKQATLIRGVIAARVLGKYGIGGEYTLIFFSDTSLKNVAVIFPDIRDEHLKTVIGEFSANSDVRDIMLTLGQQVRKRSVDVRRRLKERDIQIDSVAGTIEVRNLLRILPIDQVTVATKFAFTRERVHEVRLLGGSTLWDNSEVVDNYIIPSAFDIENALAVASPQKEAQFLLILRLERAKKSWENYKNRKETYPVEITTLEKKITHLGEVDLKFLDFEPVKTTVITREISSLKTKKMRLPERKQSLETERTRLLAELSDSPLINLLTTNLTEAEEKAFFAEIDTWDPRQLEEFISSFGRPVEPPPVPGIVFSLLQQRAREFGQYALELLEKRKMDRPMVRLYKTLYKYCQDQDNVKIIKVAEFILKREVSSRQAGLRTLAQIETKILQLETQRGIASEEESLEIEDNVVEVDERVRKLETEREYVVQGTAMRKKAEKYLKLMAEKENLENEYANLEKELVARMRGLGFVLEN